MAANVALSELRQRARELADMETSAQASAPVDDTELNRRVNSALKQLYQRLIITRGDDYYAKSHAFPTVANQAVYAVPADFFQLLNVSVTDGSNHRDVHRWGMKDWSALRQLEQGGASSAIENYRYRIVGQSFEVRPQPTTAAHTFTIYYLPAFSPLVNDADTFDGVNGWEDWACYTAAIDMLTKEESFEQAQALAAVRAAIEKQIDTLAGARDAAMPERVQDVRKDWATTRRMWSRNNWND